MLLGEDLEKPVDDSEPTLETPFLKNSLTFRFGKTFIIFLRAEISNRLLER
jgi:hypothetical protein